MTSRTAQKRKRTRASNQDVDPLERALRSTGPRCQCEHGSGRCRRRATHRVSAICVEPGCGTAVHVTLLCAECKDSWVHQASHDPTAPDLRVTPL